MLKKWWRWWLSHQVVSDSCAPWTVACQAPPSMGFSRQEYWSRLPFPSPVEKVNECNELVRFDNKSKITFVFFSI